MSIVCEGITPNLTATTTGTWLCVQGSTTKQDPKLFNSDKDLTGSTTDVQTDCKYLGDGVTVTADTISEWNNPNPEPLPCLSLVWEDYVACEASIV